MVGVLIEERGKIIGVSVCSGRFGPICMCGWKEAGKSEERSARLLLSCVVCVRLPEWHRGPRPLGLWSLCVHLCVYLDAQRGDGLGEGGHGADAVDVDLAVDQDLWGWS